jgi:ATP:ADP antiporter, AAA family
MSSAQESSTQAASRPSTPASRLAAFAAKVFPVQRQEWVSALLLLTNVFVLLTCYYVLKVVREPLILLGGGAELKAYASAGQSLLLVVVVPLFGILASRVNRVQLLTVVQSIFAVCLIGFYALAEIEAPIGLAFYLWLGIFNVMVVSNFWAFANDVYTPEQGKRLFPIVGLGGSAGAILGALLPSWLESVFGTGQLLLVAAVGLGVSIVLYRLVDRRERFDRDPGGLIALLKPEAKHPVGREGGFTLVLKDRYLRLMAVMVLVATVSNTTGEYVIGKLVVDASKAAANPGAFIGDFYSSYYAWVNIISALLQGLAVAYVLRAVGIRRALWIMPVVVVVGWVNFLLFSTLAMIRITKTAENSVDYSLHNTLRQALYLPTSRESKYKAKAAIDTFFFRFGDVVAAIGLVFVLVDVLHLGVTAFAWINAGLAMVWIFLVIRIGRLHDQRTVERAARAAQGLRETVL